MSEVEDIHMNNINRVVPHLLTDYVNHTVRFAIEIGSNEIRSIYLAGSLVYGGFTLSSSDIDIDIIIREDLNKDIPSRKIGNRIMKHVRNQGFNIVTVKSYTLSEINDRKTFFTFGDAIRASVLYNSALIIYGEDIRHHIITPSSQELCQESINVIDKLLLLDLSYWEKLSEHELATMLALPGSWLFQARTGQVRGKITGLAELTQFYESYIPDSVKKWIYWAYYRLSNLAKIPLQDHEKKEIIPAIFELFAWSQNQLHEFL